MKLKLLISILFLGSMALLSTQDWADTCSGTGSKGAAVAAGGTPTVLQQTGTAMTASGASSIAQLYASTVTVHSLLTLAVTFDGTSATISSVSDNLNGAWTAGPATTDSNNQRFALYYKADSAAGTCTVTVSFSDSIAYRGITVMEVSNIATTSPLDVTGAIAATNSNATDGTSSGNITTVSDGDFIFSATVNSDAAATTITEGTGYTIGTKLGGLANYTQAQEDRIQTTHGAIAGTFTFGTARHGITGIMAFKHN
jgi:hypothetical protein